MKEHPIIFNGSMVRAIIDGRKTQTRRPLKPQPAWECVGKPSIDFDGEVYRVFINEGKYAGWTTTPYWRCQYGQPGDRLWVRETWAPLPGGMPGPANGVVYRADEDENWLWSPSIHMPRWASRITMEVVSVRVERIQDITDADVIAEGTDTGEGAHFTPPSPRMLFALLWDSIYAKRGFGWDANPWVWVIEFRRIER